MKIKVDNYYINTDSQGNVYITEEVISEKSGKMQEVRVSGYYTDFRTALFSMFRRKLFKSNVTTLEGAIDYMQNMYNECEKVLKGGLASGM